MPYYCHNCNNRITDGELPEFVCPACESGFIEEVTLEELALRASLAPSGGSRSVHDDNEDSRSSNPAIIPNDFLNDSSIIIEDEKPARIHPGPSSSSVPITNNPSSSRSENRNNHSNDRPSTSGTTFNRNSSSNDFSYEDEVRPPIPPVRQVLVQNPPSYSSDLPHRYSSRSRTSGVVYDAFRDFQAEAEWQEMNREGEGSAVPTLGEKSAFGRLYMPPLDILFRGTFDEARERAQSINKWLLVNVQNSQEFSCAILNRDVWSHQAVKEIMREHFIFWQIQHDTFQGRRYMQFYNVKHFPYVAIVDPRTGEQMRAWPQTIDHNSFCDSVIEFLSNHGSDTNDSLEKLSPQSQTEKTDNVLPKLETNSNGSSHIKIEQSVEEIDTLIDELPVEDEEVDSKSESNTTSAQMQPKVEDYRNYLGSDDKCSELIIRFPDGSRDKFEFPVDSKMKALFLLLASRGYDSQCHNYLTNFPRRYINELSSDDSFADLNLVKETIYVEKKQ